MDDFPREADGIRNRAERREVLALKIEVANLRVQIATTRANLILLRAMIERDPPALEIAMRTIEECLAAK